MCMYKIEARSCVLNQLLQSMKKFDVIGSDDSAFVYAKILGQAADDGIRDGEHFPDNCPDTLTRRLAVLFNQRLRIFNNTRAVNDQRDRVFSNQRFHVPYVLHPNGPSPSGLVA